MNRDKLLSGLRTRSIVEPVPAAVHKCADTLMRIAELMLSGDLVRARKLIDGVDTGPLSEYFEGRKTRRRGLKHILGTRKSTDRKELPSRSLQQEVFERDGWRCRYCGIRLLANWIPKEFNCLPGQPLWTRRTNPPNERHRALYVLWGSVDHVVPATMFGSDVEANDKHNLVASCTTCNFGKENFTLEQLRLLDPRNFPPIASPDWDGLFRLEGISKRFTK